MKVAVSIPDPLFKSSERLGKRLGLTRSGLYAAALADYAARHEDAKITARLNEVYSREESRVEPSLRRAQARSLPKDAW